MSWEARARGGTYYTRTRREGGRRVREYVGTGPAAELAAAEDAMRREARERAATDQRTERERLAALEAPLLAVDALGDALLAAALTVAGYHRHQRGAWRRRRERRGSEGAG